MQVLHQEVNNGGSSKQTPAQGGIATDGGIRGRKMDTPHLVVVKELKEQEEFDQTMRANNILKHGGVPRRSRMQEDLLNLSLLNNSGFLGISKPIQDLNNKQRSSKSQENRRNKSKERRPAVAVALPKPQPTAKVLDDKKTIQQVKPANFNKNGTKSSRETVKTTSLGLNELLIVDQQAATTQLGQGQGGNDFKNRTHYEILKQANNGDLKSGGIKTKKVNKAQDLQTSNNQAEQRQQSRSRSRDRKTIQAPIKILAQNLIQAVLPKSIHSRDRNQVNNEPRKISSISHAHTDHSANKGTATSFIQQDQARCVTSQGLAHQSQQNLLSLNTNGRTLSQPNLVKSTASKSSRFILQTESSQPTDTAATFNRQQQSSPDRSQSQMIKSVGIDRLVKQNLLKMRSKMEEEKIQRQISQERLRKKKEMLDMSNNMVRKFNKDKTYKNPQQTNNAIGNQQSQDYVPSTSNPTTIDYPGANPKAPSKKLDLKLLKQQINFQKLSQSQKIDFNLIHDSKTAQHLPAQQQHNPSTKGLNNHRKSYGLEFIDIKKEINEELKTIEQRHHHFHHKDSADASRTIPWDDQNDMGSSNRKANSLRLDQHQVPRRLKIKQSSKVDPQRLIVQDSEMLDHHHNLTQSSFLDTSSAGCQGHQHNKTERGGSDEQQPSVLLDNISDNPNPHYKHAPEINGAQLMIIPNQKILVIKKSKIRKFMKMKKREKQKEMQTQQNNEILRTIKMQENITRLNEFCKKNLQKACIKKRTTTIQQHQYQPHHHDNPKLKTSGRKLDDHIYNESQHNNPQNDESSRLSTEFYEEYFHAIKTLKSTTAGQSRQQHTNAPIAIGGTSLKVKQSPTNKQSMVGNRNGIRNLESPKEGEGKSKLNLHLPKQSKSSLSNTTMNAVVIKNKFKKPKTSKSRDPNLNHGGLIISETHQNIISNFIAKKRQRNKHSQDRSESAPLCKKKQPASSSSRLNTTNINESMKKTQSGNSKERKLKNQMLNNSSGSKPKNNGVLEIELELMHIYLNNQATKIQRAFRNYLYKNCFYNDYIESEEINDASTVQRQHIPSSQSQLLINTTEEDEKNATVRRDENRTLEYLITDGELAECPDTTIQQQPQLEEELEYDDEEDESDEEDIQHPQMIIINQDQMMDGDKKIVYLSNINSCSLPQTPKMDENSSTSNHQIETKKIPQVTQGTFDYIAKKNGFILEQINNRRGSQARISQSSSVKDQNQVQQEFDSQLDPEESCGQNNSQAFSQEQTLEKEDQLRMEEVKQAQDYGMRMFTGSESMLRDIKTTTPREQKSISSAFKDMIQRSYTQSASNKNMTSQNSQQSFQTIQVQGFNQMVDQQQHQTNTTSSHQSIFDRNSFQNFTAQKLQDMIRNNEFLNLISMRERALDYRHDKERRQIKKLYKARQMSPRTYTEKKDKLERWVRLEQEDIQKTKVQYQEEWVKAIKMIEDTQKNVLQMKEQISSHDIGDHHHPSASGKQQNNGLLSSRNSSSSFYNTQYSCQKGGPERKSILEKEEYQPLSHRSSRLVQSAQKNTALISIEQKLTIADSTINQQEQTKPNLFKTHLTTLEEGSGTVKNAGNLIDFLEDSWKKTQQVSINKQTIPISTNPDPNRILIQDQRSNYDLEISMPASPEKIVDSHQSQEEELLQEAVETQTRPLMRSRSEQDLTDLLKNSKIDIDQENQKGLNSSQNLGFEQDNENMRGGILLDADESFRLIDSERQQQNQNSQIHIITKKNDEIRIQENLFDDSSQRQPSSSLHLPTHNISSSNNDPLFQHLHPLDQELPSQDDSLLNEQELNLYFNNNKDLQKRLVPAKQLFSIEDFKQLDKRKLLLAQGVSESARSQFELLYDDDEDELISRGSKIINQSSARDELKAEDGIMAEEKQITVESAQSISNEGAASAYYNPQLIQENVELPQTSSFLFQNAKPGENIKIADILRKNAQQQQMINVVSIQPIQENDCDDENNSSQNEKEQIVFEIAEDILRMLIDEQVQIPHKPFQKFDSKNLEASPEYSFINPQRIQENNENSLAAGPIPIFTFDALELDEISLEPKQHLQTSPQNINQVVMIPQPEQQQQDINQNQDVFFVDNSMNEKEQRRELIDLRQRMLIESDLQRIEAYINEIITTLQQHELNFLEGMSGQGFQHLLAEPNFHRQFLQVLTIPIKRSQLDVLNHLQTSEIGSYEHFETAMDIGQHPILPVDLYLDIERQREENNIRILSSSQDQSVENSCLQESVHIHNKGIFDALNESLMKFRPYGIQGEPMPWSNKVRRLQTKVDTSQVDTERLFFMVKQDVMRWASNCVGCLPSQVFLVRRGGSGPVPPMEQFDEEIFQETRERRLAQMLASEVVETEHQWLNYEFEESQVKIDMSDMILEHLVDEVVQYLSLKNTKNCEQQQAHIISADQEEGGVSNTETFYMNGDEDNNNDNHEHKDYEQLLIQQENR